MSGPVNVGVITAETQNVPFTVTLPARAVAFQDAKIRPTVEGIVESVDYEPGARVSAGDLMFTLRKDRYAAAAAAARAETAGAQGAVDSAQKTVDRYRELVGSGVTQADLDPAEAALLQAKATLSSANSAVTVADLDLTGTEICSPIDGISSVAAISVGAVVTANQTDALATVTRLDPIYIDMTESSARMLRVRAQENAGAASELDRVQAQALLEEARASLPALETGFENAVYGIATLLAEPAGPLMADLRKGAPQPYPKGGSAAGVPADLFRNRSDVRASERKLAAAVANVGIAEADLYPSVSLTGTVTAAGNGSWGFGPSLSLPVASQSRLRASRAQAISQAKQAELDWRAQILNAVEDTQSAQSAYRRNQRALATFRSTSASYARALELSRATYSAGTTDLLNLLDAEMSRSTVRLSVAGDAQNLTNSWINLQVSTGRGWAATP
ncbi:efflux RND transporter periplasmic adaptor subunit [Roseobacter sp. GAI101]|uniref:efflux RND transporter periplasmic adaptor subunit n=1 Tax=Roseobacter sp. (strain GAI101) TaxID=391589 RepID=UPI0001871A40|nr:efflux RND transporter periplasmic adaptor subunit [Roseobacter sp. GAI101]EEB82576.1 RND efflux system, outer membrane lipoprotein, NodT family [Roseobacter sp. GAI101]